MLSLIFGLSLNNHIHDCDFTTGFFVCICSYRNQTLVQNRMKSTQVAEKIRATTSPESTAYQVNRIASARVNRLPRAALRRVCS